MTDNEASSESRRGSGLWPMLLLTVGVAVLVLWRAAEWQWTQGLSSLREEARGQLALRVAHLHGALERFEVLPRLLGNDEGVVRFLSGARETGAAERMSRYLADANRLSGAADIYLMDTRGLTLAASNWDSATSFVGENFSYRPYFQAAIAGEPGHYFALGTTSLRRGFYFSAPVRTGERILGVVAVKVDVPAIEQSWAPMEGEILVTDADGVIFMSTRSDWLYRALRPLAPDAESRIRGSRRYPGITHKPFPVRTWTAQEAGGSLLQLDLPAKRRLFLRHASYLMVEEPMVDAGWMVHLLLPTYPVEVRVLNVLSAMGGGIIIVALLTLFLRQRRKRKQERQRFEADAKRSLAASEARIRAIIENTHAGLVTLDEEGSIESINATAREMFGLDAEGGWIGRPLDKVLAGPADLFAPGPALGAREAVGLRSDGGRFPVEVAVRDILLARGRRHLVTLHDITARKRIEDQLREARDTLEARVRERTADLTASNVRLQAEIVERSRAEAALREAQDQLIQAVKLASLGEMAASISHEINQPLAAIRTYADNARQLLDHSREEDARANLGQIAQLTERMARISGQLKAFARKTSGTLEPVEVAEVVQAALDLVTPLARKSRVALTSESAEPPGLSVIADRVQLEQVLINLLTNAVQAAEGGTHAVVGLKVQRIGEEAVVTVEDSGAGLDDEKLSAVFEPFFTTKRSGLGLGLSISQRLMEGMRGRLTAANRTEGGAVFSAILPVAEDAAIGTGAASGH